MQVTSGSSVRFSSRIQFVTEDEFDRLPMMKDPSSALCGGLNVFEKDAYTKGALMCNAGGVALVGPKKVALFHFLGDDYCRRHEAEQLAAQVASMKQEDPQMRAVLVGGRSSWWESVELADKLKKFFQNAGIPFSLFWGQNDPEGESHIAYSPAKDTWYIRTSYKKDPSDVWHCGEVESLPELKKAFEEIEVDPGDEVVLGGKTYQGQDCDKRWEIFGS